VTKFSQRFIRANSLCIVGEQSARTIHLGNGVAEKAAEYVEDGLADLVKSAEGALAEVVGEAP
jgi:hypothetical protein